MKNVLCILTILLTSFVANAGGQDLCEPQLVYKEKVVYVKEYVDYPIEIEVQRNVTKKNRLSVLVGNGPSNALKYTVVDTDTAIVTHEDANIGGLLYQRDISNLTLGVMGLSNKSVGVTLGVNW